jgi:hypothetical protein
VHTSENFAVIRILPQRTQSTLHKAHKEIKYETNMIQLTQVGMKIHHASYIQTLKNKLFTDEKAFKILKIKKE